MNWQLVSLKNGLLPEKHQQDERVIVYPDASLLSKHVTMLLTNYKVSGYKMSDQDFART